MLLICSSSHCAQEIATPWPLNSFQYGPRVEFMRTRLQLSPSGTPESPTSTTPQPFSPASLAVPLSPPPAVQPPVLAPMVICLFLPGPDSAARVMVGDSGLSVRSRATAFLERSTTMARRVIAGDYAINGKDCFINTGSELLNVCKAASNSWNLVWKVAFNRSGSTIFSSSYVGGPPVILVP